MAQPRKAPAGRSSLPGEAPTVTIISTGEELRHGHVVDTNSAFIARHLSLRGFYLRRLVTVGDDAAEIKAEVLRAAGDSAIIVMSGGLGPTADDRSRHAVAAAAGKELAEDPDSVEHIRSLLQRHGRELTPENRRQAMFPSGSHIFPNARGTARGFACAIGSTVAAVIPGVPDEMRAMFTEEVVPFLLERFRPSNQVVVATANIFGVPESAVDAEIGRLMEPGRNPSVGVTANDSIIQVCVTARAPSKEEAERLAQTDIRSLKQVFGEALFGPGEQTLAAALSELLEQQNLTISVAESCTGGLVGDMLTDVAGISRFLLADLVCYSDKAKVELLGVPPGRIRTFGAVSPEVAESMAAGARKATGSDIGLSTTGIAGPSGGSARKPVGLVYVGLSLGAETYAERLNLSGDRMRIKDRAAKHAINQVRLALVRKAAGLREEPDHGHAERG